MVPAIPLKVLEEDMFICALHGSAMFQLLKAGVGLGVFDALHELGPAPLQKLVERTHLTTDRLDPLISGLVVCRILRRQNGLLSNSDVIERIFSRGEWHVVKAMIDFQAEIVAPGQQQYTESVRENGNLGVRIFPGNGATIYERLRFNERLQDVFFSYMQSYTSYAAKYLLDNISFDTSQRVLDVGGGRGALAAYIAQRYTSIRIAIIDLDDNRTAADRYLRDMSVADRVVYQIQDIHKLPFPEGYDDVLFAHQLVIWSES